MVGRRARASAVKTLVGIIAGIIIAVVSGLTLNWFQEQAKNKAPNPNALSAEVYSGPWHYHPDTPPPEKEYPSPDDQQEIAKASNNGGSPMTRVRLLNSGQRVATNIRMQVPQLVDGPFLLVDPDGHERRIDGSGTIDFPDMKPGDSVTLYTWSQYVPSPFLEKDGQGTYSSEGRWQITTFVPAKETEEEFNFWNEISELLVFILLAISAIAILLLVAIWKYAEGLLKDDAKYQQERERYLSDPQKFAAKLD